MFPETLFHEDGGVERAFDVFRVLADLFEKRFSGGFSGIFPNHLSIVLSAESL